MARRNASHGRFLVALVLALAGLGLLALPAPVARGSGGASSTAVACNPSTFTPGVTISCTATVTDPSASGASAPSGTVTWTTNAPTQSSYTFTSSLGTYLSGKCSLSAIGGSNPPAASCSVTYSQNYTSPPPYPPPASCPPITTPAICGYYGTPALSATYGGDSSHPASSGSPILNMQPLTQYNWFGSTNVGNPCCQVSAGPNNTIWYSNGVITSTCGGTSNPNCATVVEVPLDNPQQYKVIPIQFSGCPYYGCSTYGITLGPEGNMWFTELFSGTIGAIDPSTGAVAIDPATGKPKLYKLPPDATHPKWLTAGPKDSNPADGQALWFTMQGSQGNYNCAFVVGGGGQCDLGLGEIDTSGNLIQVLLIPYTAQGIDVTSGPGPNGKNQSVWFTSVGQGFNEVMRYDPPASPPSTLCNLDGTPAVSIPCTTPSAGYALPSTMTGGPEGITVGSDGAVWFTDTTAPIPGTSSVGGALGRIDSTHQSDTSTFTLSNNTYASNAISGAITQFGPILPTSANSPTCQLENGEPQLAVGPDGNLYMSGATVVGGSKYYSAGATELILNSDPSKDTASCYIVGNFTNSAASGTLQTFWAVSGPAGSNQVWFPSGLGADEYVIPDTTTTAVSCSPTPIATGANTVCTAKVTDTSSSASTPTGTVGFTTSSSGGSFSAASGSTFSAGPPPTCTLSAISGSSPPAASCSVTYAQTAEGQPAINAEYYGDLGTVSTTAGSTGFGQQFAHAPSSSSGAQISVQATTSTSVTCTPTTFGTTANNSSTPTSTSCTAKVTDTSTSNPSAPTGTASWATNGTGGSFTPGTSCTLSASSGSGAPSASCTVTYAQSNAQTALTLGAAYGGDTLHLTSNGSSPSLTVQAATSTAVICSSTNITTTQSTVCKATVMDSSSNPSTPNGTVAWTVSPSGGSFSAASGSTFSAGPPPACTLAGSGSAASCSVTYAQSSAGTPTLTATYNGDTAHAGSNGNLGLTVVAQAATSLSAVSGSGAFGGTATLTATLSSTAPCSVGSQTISFTLNGQPFSNNTVQTNSNGVATLTGVSLVGADADQYPVGASFAGTLSCLASNGSGTLTVAQVTTTTTLSSSENPSNYGDAVTFTATVSPAAGMLDGGTVQFAIDGSAFGNALPISTTTGQASISDGALSVGSHSIVATYSGDTNFAASASQALAQTVKALATTTAISSSANPVESGQSVTFTATVTPLPDGGSVTFSVDGTAGQPVALSGSQATFTTSSLSVGNHSVVASYGGDTNYAPSGSQPLTQAVNSPPTVSAASDSGIEGQSISLTGTASDSDGDGISSYLWTAPSGTPCAIANASQVSTTVTCTEEGSYTLTLVATDSAGFTGSATAAITVNDSTPVVTAVTTPSSPAAINTSVQASGSFTDAGSAASGESYTATWDWGDGTTGAGVATPPSGSTPGSVTGSHTYTAAGVYTVTLTVADDDNTESAPVASSQYVVVYDSSAGFVTGGGWIDSPAGACVAADAPSGACSTSSGGTNSSASGRASFGFVAEYLPGATVPSGNTEFQFQAGRLNFHSTAYNWLVVQGGSGLAQYQGTGTINGQGGYDFTLTVYDHDLNSSCGSTDGFRIQISNANGGVVYDNMYQLTSNEIDCHNTQSISGGDIVIHTS